MICNVCKIDKNYPDIYIRGSGKPRRACKACYSLYKNGYRKRNSKAVKDTSRRYRRSVAGRFTTLKSAAKSKNLICNIDIQCFEKIHNEPCNYCGDNFDRRAGYGIDRIDFKIGYTKENSVACCSKCNFAKNILEYDEFIKHILKIANHMTKNHKY